MSGDGQVWSVGVVLDDADSRLLSRWEFMELMHPESVWSLRIGPDYGSDGDGPQSIRFQISASSSRDAEQQALNLVYQARRAAKLPDAVLPVAWVSPVHGPGGGPDYLEEAEDLLDGEHHEMAVIAADVHLKAQIRAILDVAAKRAAPSWAASLLQSRGATNLNRQQGQEIIKNLLGIEVTTVPEWSEVKAHLTRRNAIAHEGQPIEDRDAAASIAAVKAFWLRLSAALRDLDAESRQVPTSSTQH